MGYHPARMRSPGRLTTTAVAVPLALAAWLAVAIVAQGPAPLPAPEFHHLHLNSVNPEAAIDFYTRQFPTTAKDTFAGQPALKSPTDVWILFTKVATPPPTEPATAFWHFGWHVTDIRQSAERFRQQGVTLVPLYREEAGATVVVSSDTWPGVGGVLGLTKAGIAAAKAKGVQPAGGGGFAYVRGPDDALIEYQGNQPRERFNHIHMYQEQPLCAQLWYQRHLNQRPAPAGATAAPPRTEATCRVERGPDRTWPALNHDGMYRTPSLTSMAFSDVSLFAYMNQTDRPLASTRGHLIDHYGLRVADLDGWIAKLRGEGVTFLEPPYALDGHRAVLIEGPSREAIELVEIR